MSELTPAEALALVAADRHRRASHNPVQVMEQVRHAESASNVFGYQRRLKNMDLAKLSERSTIPQKRLLAFELGEAIASWPERQTLARIMREDSGVLFSENNHENRQKLKKAVI
jgi:hypothetical protein